MASFRTRPLYTTPDDRPADVEASTAPQTDGEEAGAALPVLEARTLEELSGGADAPAAEVEAELHALEVTRSARYYTVGAAGGDVREVWYVLHGYGQLAASFIRPFAALDNAGRRIVAPEALSRFYLDDAHRRVGASWMTREDRRHEIDDYLAYLDTLHQRVMADLDADAVQLHVLGFSQGCETAARWVTLGSLRPHRLILWGGRVPDDLDLAAHRDLLRRLRLTLVYGTEDTYATAERIGEVEERLNRHTIPFLSISFDGGHHLDGEVLQELAAG